jgi:hypothetical protein
MTVNKQLFDHVTDGRAASPVEDTVNPWYPPFYSSLIHGWHRTLASCLWFFLFPKPLVPLLTHHGLSKPAFFSSESSLIFLGLYHIFNNLLVTPGYLTWVLREDGIFLFCSFSLPCAMQTASWT